MSKLRPILFSTAMVQALLADNKTQTRRIVKLPKWSTNDWDDFTVIDDYVSTICESTGCEAAVDCPYGQPGDVLWVRESMIKNLASNTYWPVADGYKRSISEETGKPFKHEKSVPSIHMPYAACRLWLKITDVRAERLQDISQDDSFHEGVDWRKCPVTMENPTSFYDYREGYKDLWESINGADSWEANPFVWVVTFERTEKPQQP